MSASEQCTTSIAATEPAILIALLILAPAVTAYAFFFAFRPWRDTPPTRALMIKAISNMVLIDMGLAYALFGDYPFRQQIRLVGFTLLIVGIWYLLISLLTSEGAADYPPRTWLRRLRRSRSNVR